MDRSEKHRALAEAGNEITCTKLITLANGPITRSLFQ